MYYFNNPYNEVPFFNGNQINELKGLNPLESNRLLGDFFTYLTKKRINKSQIYRTITERLQNA
jgi:hypothetical protein